MVAGDRRIGVVMWDAVMESWFDVDENGLSLCHEHCAIFWV